MLLAPCRPKLCIFCAFRASFDFSSTSSIARSTRGQKKPLRRNSNSDQATHTSKPRFRGLNSRPLFPKPVDYSINPSSPFTNARHKSFKPHQRERIIRFDRTPRIPSTPADIHSLVTTRLDLVAAALRAELHKQGYIFQNTKLTPDRLDHLLSTFASRFGSVPNPSDPLWKRLEAPAKLNRTPQLDLELKYAFFGHIIKLHKSDFIGQGKSSDLRYPHEWFPDARRLQREIHVHVGPTNSGKTYHALKRLEESKTGLYAGPLRLLAHEVFMRLNSRGVRCNLITGDDRRTADDDPLAPMMSCTVEMVPVGTSPLDVAVIDEIQMIGSEDRGWAWTQALLGVCAKEVHLCGEERALPVLQEIAATCGESLHIHRYERLSPLKVMRRSLDNDFNALEKGDCIVGFSIVTLHSLRQMVEKMTKRKCAVIYGALPPETRAQQAALFNDPNNDYDFLIASNAIGMGLNLLVTITYLNG